MLRLLQALPIEAFVRLALKRRDVEEIMADWPIDREIVAKILTKHYQDIGVFVVNPYQDADYLYRNLKRQLKRAPVFHVLIKKEQERQLVSRRRDRG